MRLLTVAAFACALAASATASIGTKSTRAYPPAPPVCSGPDSGRGGTNCTIRPATISVHTEAPVFVKSVKNGKRYLGGSGNDTFHVAHLYSDTDDLYEMGYALGQMFPDEINDMFSHIEPWLADMLSQAVPWLPKWISDIIVDKGMPLALDVIFDITKDYIPKDYLDEWQGMADGAGCNVSHIQRVSLFPQLSKAACTILVAHDKATTGQGVNQLRALDFAPLSYVADFSSIVVYHYKNKPKLANFGWIAMTGVLTGMNSVPMSAGEKDWGHKNPLLPYGLPWMQMMRRSLEMENVTALNDYITNHNQASSSAPNTVSIHLGYGDQSSNEVVGYEVAFNHSKRFAWNTHTPSPTHPLFDGIVYWSKNDPAHTMCPADMLSAQYGSIDAEWMAMYYSPNDKTGDTQVVGFDLQSMKVWFANSRKSTTPIVDDEPLCAYYRQRSVLDMAEIFAESAPTV